MVRDEGGVIPSVLELNPFLFSLVLDMLRASEGSGWYLLFGDDLTITADKGKDSGEAGET